MPKLIKIDSLIEGMVLAEAVINKLGQVIIAKNTLLTLKQINTLRMWGINQVLIKSLDSEMEISEDLAIIEESKSKIKAELDWKVNNIFTDELIELAAYSIVNRKKD
jgi:hypothetical protein